MLAKEWMLRGRLGEVNMIDMTMWINNPNETSPHFHMRALHPHSLDVMRYFAQSDASQVHAIFKKGKGRAIWSNVQVNILYENGIIGHLRGSYDGNWGHTSMGGGSYGLETLDVFGSDGRVFIRDACEELIYYPRFKGTLERHEYYGGMKHFGETFQSRINHWVDQNLAGVSPDKIDASGADGLHVQKIIEAAIESWDTKQVVSL